MIYILVSHRVKDFEAWKQVYDSHDSLRNEFGMETRKIFRSVNDPEHVHVLFSSPSIEAFEELSVKGDLKAVMEKAGVIGEPEINFLKLA